MSYVPLNSNSTYQKDFYTLQNLLDLCFQYPQHEFKFVDTNYSPNVLISWRGSYSTPAILVDECVKTGAEIVDFLNEQIEHVHHGYKGGEYKYFFDDEFYVVTCDSNSNEHAVNGYKIEDGVVWLITNINTY